jgi:hypothetical protein
MASNRSTPPPRHVEPGHGDQRTYSPRAIRPDGTYAGLAAGYGGPAHSEGPAADAAMPGEGTYGYPFGPGIGDTGGRRPDDEAADLAAAPQFVPEDPDPNPGPGDRFGAGRQRWWRGPADAGRRDAERQTRRIEVARGEGTDHRHRLRDLVRALREAFVHGSEARAAQDVEDGPDDDRH